MARALFVLPILFVRALIRPERRGLSETKPQVLTLAAGLGALAGKEWLGRTRPIREQGEEGLILRGPDAGYDARRYEPSLEIETPAADGRDGVAGTTAADAASRVGPLSDRRDPPVCVSITGAMDDPVLEEARKSFRAFYNDASPDEATWMDNLVLAWVALRQGVSIPR